MISFIDQSADSSNLMKDPEISSNNGRSTFRLHPAMIPSVVLVPK